MLTAEQLAERREGLGASDAAPAVGLSPWTTKYELYREKVGELVVAANDDDALHLEMGHALEPIALSRFCKRTHFQVSGHQTKVTDPQWAQRWVRVDAFSSDGGYVEAKSIGFADPEQWGDENEDGAVPMYIFLQVQHGLACTGLPHGWVPLIVSNRQFRLYHVKRDDDLIHLLTTQEREFWAMVESRTPPAPADLDDASLRWPSHVAAKRVTATDGAATALALHAAAKKRHKKSEAEIKEFELVVKQHMTDAAELVDVSGNLLCTWKQAKPSLKFDEDQFALDQPALYRKYLREQPGSRRFLNKLMKESD